MKQEPKPRDLTYALKVHPGESWPEVRTAMFTHATAVRARFRPDHSFGLGLRLSAQAASGLTAPEVRSEVLARMQDEGLYVFTIDGFAHGRFHQGPIKEKMYQPDWRTTARREYTIQLIDILADWLPEGGAGSINTVPGSFKPWVLRPDDPGRMVREIIDCALHLMRLRESRGKDIRIGLEPQPGCFIETTDEAVKFFKDRLLTDGVREMTRRSGVDSARAEESLRRHVGICFDTCAQAIQFEDLAASLRTFRQEGIQVVKLQLSAGLEVFNERSRIEALHPFVEPTYLHPVKVQTRHGAIRSWNDLPDALRIVKDQAEYERLRIDFRVPLHWTGTALLSSTASALTPAFFDEASRVECPHLEVETYTWGVTPEILRPTDLIDSCARELRWVADRWPSKRSTAPSTDSQPSR